MKKSLGLFAGAALVLFAGAADAHTLRLECHQTNAGNAVCRGFFTDGEVARGMQVQLIDEHDKVLTTAKTDTKGEYAYKIPAGEYNVVVQASKSEVASMSGEDIW